MKWDLHSWYSLCAKCLKRYEKEGGWCDLKNLPMRCSICGAKAIYEFYPILK